MKRLFVFAVALAAVAPAYGCTEGEKMNMDCNTCVCRRGYWTCTREMCIDLETKKNFDLEIDSKFDFDDSELREISCTPGHSYEEYCNFCKCLDDGKSYRCSKSTCDKNIWNKDGTFKFSSKRRLARQVPRQICRPGTTFRDDCNGCTCSNDGTTAYCTQMLCPNYGRNNRGKREVLEKKCIPNQYFKDYCNTCLCGDDGTVLTCSDLKCDKNIFNQDGTLNGASQVLESATSTTISNKVCEPGALTSLDGICNICICNKEGTQSACTKNHCSSSLIKIFEEEEKWGPLYKQGDACIPGKGFYSECNQCVCRADGRSAFCTFMACVT